MSPSRKIAGLAVASVFTVTVAALITLTFTPVEIYSQSRTPDSFDPLAWKFDAAGNLGAISPTVQGAVFVASYNDHLYALESSTGDVWWRYNTDGNVTSPPAVADGLVYLILDQQYVYALDATNGNLRWRFQPEVLGDIGSSQVSVQDGVVFVRISNRWIGSGGGGYTGSELFALDAVTGDLLFHYHPGRFVHTLPAATNGVA